MHQSPGCSVGSDDDDVEKTTPSKTWLNGPTQTKDDEDDEDDEDDRGIDPYNTG